MKILVVGAGVAGLTAALRADALGHDVELVVKGALGDGCTALAQGGIAGAYGPGDSPALHALDTMQAGAGHGDPAAIAALVDDADQAVSDLVAHGVPFDRAADGSLLLAKEAAHTLPRIAHAGGDATGRAISDALIARLHRSRVGVREQSFAADLIVEDGAARGIRLLDGTRIDAEAVVLATGGAGHLHPRTTNPLGTTGDGIAMALRAGAAVADLEFLQFHPTVLAAAGDAAPFLISEAVRGAGAVLRDAQGHRFLADEHPDAELAPRDVVARAVARAGAHGAEVLLDATGVPDLARRFPTIDAELRRRGFDWARRPVPVSPAAHYLMGGVVTDLDGRTSLSGLWAAGETARTGVHGANRLASNSLLEGVVFGTRLAQALADPAAPASSPASSPHSSAQSSPPSSPHSSTRSSPRSQWMPLARPSGGIHRDLDAQAPPSGGIHRDRDAQARPSGGIHRDGDAQGPTTPPFSRAALQAVMWDHVGLLRDDAGLAHAMHVLNRWHAAPPPTDSPAPAAVSPAAQEDANLLTVARAMASAALARTESLGAHFRLSPALIGAA